MNDPDAAVVRRNSDLIRRRPLAVLALATFGLAVRVTYVVATSPRRLPFTDALYYQLQSISLAHGRGFATPLVHGPAGQVIPSAAHPPLYPLFLAAGSALGASSVWAHQLMGCALGAATIVGIGLVADRVGGDRAALSAMALAAVYPPLWINDGGIMAEGLFALITTAVILASYRLSERPSAVASVTLGATIGLAALTRAEASLLFVVLVPPLVLRAGRAGLRATVTLLALAGASAALVVSPWVIRNLTTFHHPVFLSTGDATLLGANCPPAYYGPGTGTWYASCYSRIKASPGSDESDVAAAARRAGFDYIGGHLSRVPVVLAVRVARVWQLYQPGKDAADNRDDGRPAWCGLVSSVGYAVLVPVAGYGALVGRRRRHQLLPLTAQLLAVSLTAALVWGAVRFRAPAEVVLVILGGIGLQAARAQSSSRRRPERGRRSPPSS